MHKRNEGQFDFLSSCSHPESTEDIKLGLIKQSARALRAPSSSSFREQRTVLVMLSGVQLHHPLG